ncbi:MAG: FAD-dependent oxidoreductase, partial [Roseburia sp.]
DDWKATLLMCCDVNPTFGHRALIGEIPAPENKKKVAVIGGGPGGMVAALEASKRGHLVDLYERQDKLGGLTCIFTDPVWFKQEDRKYREYLVRQIEKSDVTVHLKTNATKELIFETHPDAVIVAIGGKIYQPEFEGAKEIRSLNVLGIYNNEENLGKKIVIIGGGLSGCEAALHLAEHGKEIILLTPEEDIMPTVALSLRNHTVQHLDQNKKINYYTNHSIKKITSQGVVTLDQNGTEELFEADTIVYATGMRPKEQEADEFVGTAVDVIKVGDCRKIGTIGTAVHDGYDAASSLVY